MKKIGIVLLTLLLFVGCGSKEEPKDTDNKKDKETVTEKPKEEVVDYHKDTNPVVTITMENGGVIEIELYPEVAPNTVNNFISLIESGFYDGVIFHRVIPGFMIQGGDPDGNGTGGPGYAIKGEFTNNSFQNDLKHTRGVISMARSQMNDSAGSQFFIMVADYPSLNKEYASFGMVLNGMDVVDDIVGTETDAQDKPLEAQTIKTMSVDTKGVNYDAPEKVAQ